MTTFTPLGDQAALAYLPTEPDAVRFAAAVRTANPPWLQDVVPAYASVGVFFDADSIHTTAVLDWLRELTIPPVAELIGRTHRIPVCYADAFAPDLTRIAEHCQLLRDDVIRYHAATDYTVHAIGFVPGFPYLGYLPEPLRGVPRLPTPRVRVEPGSVGLTGRQTGLYPLPRPGGWNLIGRTPLTVVDVADDFFPIRVGDRVRFTRIDEAEYHRLAGERLSVE